MLEESRFNRRLHRIKNEDWQGELSLLAQTLHIFSPEGVTMMRRLNEQTERGNRASRGGQEIRYG